MRRALHALLILLLCGCSREERRITLGGRTMGTAWALRADAYAQSIHQTDLQQKLDSWEAILSHWRPDSDLSRFNSSTSTDWIAAPAELIEVVELAQQIGHDTDHALDVTIAPIVDLWGFGAQGKRDSPPTESEITAAKAKCGWQHLQIRHDPPALRKTIPDLQINVSAVAEGWALDKIAKQLESKGITNFLLEIGGEVLARGEWRVGIQTPAAPPGEAAQALQLKDQSLATSGVYRQNFTAEGKQRSHILDPRTGRPVEHELASVSVIHSSAAQADGYATALLVLGPEQGRQIAEKLGLRVVWFERGK
jgi:thiamine biosynthesis lipoprotein|uniref:FAD:protein FMN transferase n=1 Tax=Prosthecobacter sp. TaxID=1965333 RepID=UPI00378473CA